MAYVYLAGPITGCDNSQAKDWRTEITELLALRGITAVSPLRSEPDVTGRYVEVYDDPRFGTASAISGKNWFDTMRADMILVYLPRHYRKEFGLSIGTMLEIGWASANNKAIVLVTNDEKISNHPLIQRHIDWVLPDFAHALDVIDGVLGVYK